MSADDLRPPGFPTVAILSGQRRGQFQHLNAETLRIVCGPGTNIRFLTPDDPDAHVYCATLHRAASTYELEVAADHQVWVNGEPVTESRSLESGDLLEVGRGGPVIRFRIYPVDGTLQKSVAEVLSDSVNGARADSRTPLGVVARFFANLAKDLATQTAPGFRVWVLIVVSILVIALFLLVIQSMHLHSRLVVEEARIEGLVELVERTGAQALTKQDLGEIKSAVEARLAEATRRVQALEARASQIAQVIAAGSPATVFVYGEYQFKKQDTGAVLRVVEVDEGIKAFTFDERGVPVDVIFSGTGFVVSGDGEILTNRHVIEPWLGDEHAVSVMKSGLEPSIEKLTVFVPNATAPLTARIAKVSASDDLAVLRTDDGLAGIKPLELRSEMPAPGAEIVVLGYPLGVDGLMVRVSPEFLDAMSGSDHWSVLTEMAARGHIKPLATRGIISQVSRDTVVYDAETTVGGSGGPVLDLDGSVVAINRAVLGRFGGSNLGVPASAGLGFLRAPDPGPAPADPSARVAE